METFTPHEAITLIRWMQVDVFDGMVNQVDATFDERVNHVECKLNLDERLFHVVGPGGGTRGVPSGRGPAA